MVGGFDILTSRLDTNGHRRLDGPRVTGKGCYESRITDPEGVQIELTV